MITITKKKKEALNHKLAFFLLLIYGRMFTRFGPKRPSSGNTHIKNYEELLGYGWLIQSDTKKKKRELLKNPTKIEEI